ncbi:MAG TPA: LD-carboxypeptidase [Salinimicrobium sp.]|nr:LD-carboxypeptidase [Salinimicrobium sp.]
MTKPEFLKPGDKIAITATARKITPEEILPAIILLNEWGLNPVIGASIGKEFNQFAGTDEQRAEDFQQLLDNPDIKAIWCARGGYGTVRIIDQIDFSEFKKSPKWIIGYSDVTVLHSHINNLGFSTLHAQIAHNINTKSDATRESLQKALFGELKNYTFPTSEKHRIGKVKGEIIGGNLSMLYSLMGSPSDIKTDGKILFLEDLDEYLYHIDRMLMNLKRNGFFENLKGLIVGGMSDMNDNPIPFGKSAEEIIWDTVIEYDFPVIFNFPAGHIEDNRALMMGSEIELEVLEQNTTLLFL